LAIGRFLGTNYQPTDNWPVPHRRISTKYVIF